MAPARAFWKGYLKLSLVSCPIALYTGTSATERVSFRQINKKTGNRLRQQLVDEVTREPVEGEDKGRGYEYAKNTYIPVDDDELDALAIESKHTIEIDSFVPREQIDQRYLDTPYYITPNGQVGQEAFAVIREAMRGKGIVALGRVVLSKRERVIMLETSGKGLIGTTLRYPYEIRDAKEYFDDIPDVKLEPEMLKLAEHILTEQGDGLRSLAVRGSLRGGRHRAAQKETGRHAVSREHAAPQPQNVVNIMDALRRSIAQEKAAPGRRRSHPSALRDRARCCCRLRAKPKRWPRQSPRDDRAPDRKMSVEPISDRCPDRSSKIPTQVAKIPKSNLRREYR